jgi:hypothetical protein
LYNSLNLYKLVSTNRLANTLQNKRFLGSYIRHLHLSNDGLLNGASDGIADQHAWVDSLRTILQNCPRLESIFIATRPGGRALQELMYHSNTQQWGLKSLKRITISSLSFSIPTLGVNTLDARRLNHLHLIQWIPPTLSERFGTSIFQSLVTLRLSRIPLSAIRLSIPDDDKCSAQQLFDQNIHDSHHPLLLLLRECLEQYTSLQTILLEMVQLMDLDIPDHLEPWQPDITSNGAETGVSSSSTGVATGTGGFGAPFDQFSAGQPGQLASLDFPADVPLTSEEGQQWSKRQAEERDAHWAKLKHFRDLLIRYSTEMRKDYHISADDAPPPPIDFRMVAPRTMGWDRNESYGDFHNNAQASRGEEDFSAFQDLDVFTLVERFPHLGYDYAKDRMGNRVKYWTGALPRSNNRQEQ